MKILFVCTGNTCRSPLAEAALNRAAARGNLPHAAVSAGLSAFDGAPATEEAVEAARERLGADLTGHRARRVRREDVEGADVVLGMTEAHRLELLRRFPEAAAKIGALVPGKDLPDPFGCGREAYGEMADELDRAVRQWLREHS